MNVAEKKILKIVQRFLIPICKTSIEENNIPCKVILDIANEAEDLLKQNQYLQRMINELQMLAVSDCNS